MPRYTEKSWKIVDAAAQMIVEAIGGVMECADLAERFPDFTQEERDAVYLRMVKYANRMVEIAGYDHSQMRWNQGGEGNDEIDPTIDGGDGTVIGTTDFEPYIVPMPKS